MAAVIEYEYRSHGSEDLEHGFGRPAEGGLALVVDGGDPALAIHDYANVYYSYIAFSRTVDDAGGVGRRQSFGDLDGDGARFIHR